jgi:hypothetical protein
MVYRLRIITMQAFLHCLLSAPVILMLILFFAVTRGLLLRQFPSAGASGQSAASALANGRRAVFINAISVVLFGTIGTFAFLSMLSTNAFRFDPVLKQAWLFPALVGSAAGGALVMMFFHFPSAIALTTIFHANSSMEQEEQNRLRRVLQTELTWMYGAGLLLFILSAAASYLLNSDWSRKSLEALPSFRWLLPSLIPVVMSGILLRKTLMRLSRPAGKPAADEWRTATSGE